MGTMPEKPSEKELRAALEEDPDITLDGLSARFGWSATTLSRLLKQHGLRTRPWLERKHRSESRQKMSAHASQRTGPANPNYGSKPRPWLEGEDSPLRKWHRDNPDFAERQKGSNNPVHKVRHLYEDPTYVSQITRGLRAHADKKRGATYEEVYGKEKAAKYKEKLRAASPTRLAKFARKETWIESCVTAILRTLGVPFQSQVGVGHYTVDFLVPSAKLVIQTDGDYWHANPVVYPQPTAKQKDRQRLDQSCDAYLAKQGYRVLRLWERDLKSSPEDCSALIQRAVEM